RKARTDRSRRLRHIRDERDVRTIHTCYTLPYVPTEVVHRDLEPTTAYVGDGIPVQSGGRVDRRGATQLARTYETCSRDNTMNKPHPVQLCAVAVHHKRKGHISILHRCPPHDP